LFNLIINKKIDNVNILELLSADNIIIIKMKCSGKLKDGSNCTYNVHKDSLSKQFCKRHIYLDEYTEEMLLQCKYCSNCKRWIFLGEHKTCEKCRKRSVDNNKVIKEKKATEVDCDACIEKKCKIIKKGVNNNQYGKNYCNLHNKKYSWFDKLESNNRKPCNNHNRKCPTEEGLSKDSELDRCEYCTNKLLKKSREDDIKRKAKRNNAKATGNTCVYCHNIYDDPNEFIDFRGDKTTKCENCREAQRIRDRKSRESGIKKTYPMSEATKLKKKKWREENHHLMAEYCLKFRAKRMKELGEEYWKRNAENQKKWRNDNPDKVKKINKMKRDNPKYKLNYYKMRAERSNIKWELTDEEACEYFKSCCRFCGCECGETGNGIDRLNNEDGYTLENTVSCCEMCNMMKGNLSEYIFIERCRYILSHNGLIDEDIPCTNAYPLRTCSEYNKYSNTAKQKGLEFQLNKDQYFRLINQPCFICGNETYYRNINGIDRLSSDEGYYIENVKSCCSECNYFKCNYDYDNFMTKVKQINSYDTSIKYDNDKIMHIKKDMLTFFVFNKSENSFVRTDNVIENVAIGSWKISYNIDKCLLKMDYLDKVYETEERYSLSSGIHRVPFIMLSQSHNKIINICPNEILKLNNPDQAVLQKIINNCSVISSNYKNYHEFELILKIYKTDVVGIEIRYVKNKFTEGYHSCKCITCKNHYFTTDINCECQQCIDHACHSIIDNCYWCSENSYYYEDSIKDNVIVIKSDHGGQHCKCVKNKPGVINPISQNDTIIRYRKINNSKIKNNKLYSIHRHERGQLSKKAIISNNKKKMENRKKQRMQNYLDPKWRDVRIQRIVQARKDI
jgi:hypothetical protein